MTPTSKTLAAVYGLALITAVSIGGHWLGGALWARATAAYTVAALCLCGLLREVGHAIPPGDYTDDLNEDPPDPPVGDTYVPHQPRTFRRRRQRPMGRLRAARTARRMLRSHCDCDRSWTSGGHQHDAWCPRHPSRAV